MEMPAYKQNHFSLLVLKDSVDKNQNSWENNWNASPASGVFIQNLIWAHHYFLVFQWLTEISIKEIKVKYAACII